jgi:hypothetical protein
MVLWGIGMASAIETKRVVSVLLALWSRPLLKGRLIGKVKKIKEVAKDYYPVIEKLTQDGMITISDSQSAPIVLLEKGQNFLRQLLLEENFEFDGQIGAERANVLLSVLRSQPSAPLLNANHDVQSLPVEQISSYKVFKEVALETFDRLNSDFNLGNLVPIYRIRRSIGERVSRSQFNQWLLEVQSEGIIQLLESGIEDSSADKIEDSITTNLGNLRCYAKRLAA